MNCGICGNLPSDSRQLLCPECAQHSSLELRIKLLNVMSEVASLGRDIDQVIADQYIYDKVTVANDLLDVDNLDVDSTSTSIANSITNSITNSISNSSAKRNWPGLVNAKIRLLQKKHDDLIRCVQTTKQQTDELQSQIRSLKSSNALKRESLQKSRKEMYKRYDKINNELSNECTMKLNQVQTQIMPQISKLKDNRSRNLAAVFVIKRKKRKRDRVGRRASKDKGKDNGRNDLNNDDYATEDQAFTLGSDQRNEPESEIETFTVEHDLLISFSVLPDLSLLPHYSQPTINSSLERVSMFIVLCSYYLDVRLPHNIFLPGKGHPYTRIYNTSKLEKYTLRLSQSVQHSAKYLPGEFEKFCEALALLCLDMRALAMTLGIPQSSLQQVVQLNNTLTHIYNKLVPESGFPDQEPEPLGIFSESHELTLESIQEYIASRAYLEINGESAEWNIVEMDGS